MALNLKTIESQIMGQVEVARRRRNEEDRKYIVSAIGNDLVTILQPLLREIANNSRMTREELKNIISEIRVEAPRVTVPKPEVIVHTPEINVPKPDPVEIKVKLPKMPRPEVTVKPADVRIPKQMEVKGLTGMIKTLGNYFKKQLNVKLGDVDRDNPVPVILTDGKGVFYKAMGGISGGGGAGAAGVVTIRAIEGNNSNGGGTKTVTTAGTAEKLATTDTTIKRVWIQALDTNTDAVVVGGEDVDETSASRKGVAMWASQGQWFSINNLNKVWVDVAVNGEGVNYYYEQ